MRNIIILLVSFAFLASSCLSTRRISTSVTEVRDTTHVIIHDTIRITQVRDSIAFHASEHIREQQVTTYDPTTGNPIQQQLTREIDRDLDALIRHLTDSLFATHDYSAASAHAEDDSSSTEATTGQAALTTVQHFARKVASVFALCFVILLVVMAFRIYHRDRMS